MAKKVKPSAPSIDIEISNDGIEDKSNGEIKHKKSKKEKTIIVEGRKKRKVLPAIVMFFVFIGFWVVIVFNVLNIRDNYFYPFAKQIPIIGNLLPIPKEDEKMGLSKEELIASINSLETQIIQMEETYNDLKARFDDRGNEIVRLSEFADNQEEFKKDKENVDKIIALADKKQFVDYYKKIFPENAEKFYKEAVVSVSQDKETKKFINTFSQIDEESASKILEELIKSDINIVVEILKNVDTETSAAILGAMKTENAATVTRRLATSQ